MEAKDRIIVAVDVNDLRQAGSIIESLAPHVGGFKIGLEVLVGMGADKVNELVLTHGGVLFLDGKFHDIPNTVSGAVRAGIRRRVLMFNVHCLGGRKMMETARKTAEEVAVRYNIPRPLVLGVTLLSSLDYGELVEMGLMEELRLPAEVRIHTEGNRIKRFVENLALLAQDCGLDGVISSGREAAGIRKKCGSKFLIVTPGIRSSGNPEDDQKRTVTPCEAIFAGSDYLVIGRPITKAPSPVEAVQRIASEIASALTLA